MIEEIGNQNYDNLVNGKLADPQQNMLTQEFYKIDIQRNNLLITRKITIFNVGSTVI